MNDPIEQVSVEQVLDSYVADSKMPSREKLQEWIKRYPQFEHELIEFTVAWTQTEFFPRKKGQEIDRDARIRTGLNIARQVYDQQGAEHKSVEIPNKPPLRSIFHESAPLGYSPDRLAQQLNISMSIMRKIENRLLLVDSIPSNLIEKIAQTLQRTVQEVSLYLMAPPVVPQSLRLKSQQAPKINRQQSFFEAVRLDRSISDEQRSYWLSLEPPKKESDYQ